MGVCLGFGEPGSLLKELSPSVLGHVYEIYRIKHINVDVSIEGVRRDNRVVICADS